MTKTNAYMGDELPPLSFPDGGPPSPVRHIVFYPRDEMTADARKALEEARPEDRLALSEAWFDASNGSCDLTNERVASRLSFAIRMASGRYELLAWCIMPSHVHVLISEVPDVDLADIVRGWMVSVEPARASDAMPAPIVWDNRFFADTGSGKTWIAAVRRHIEGHPVAAGLAQSPGSWRWSSASREVSPLRRGPRTGPSRELARAAPSARTEVASPPRRPSPPAPRRAMDTPRKATHVLFWLDDALPWGFARKLSRRPQGQRAYLLNQALDQGHGRRSLCNRAAGASLQREIMAFDGDRYGLIAWCVMPTHVHVLLSEVGDWSLVEIVGEWKSATNMAANARRIFNRQAPGWASDHFKTELTGETEIDDVKSYIDYNPVFNGLTGDPRAWAWSSASDQRWQAGDS